MHSFSQAPRLSAKAFCQAWAKKLHRPGSPLHFKLAERKNWKKTNISTKSFPIHDPTLQLVASFMRNFSCYSPLPYILNELLRNRDVELVDQTLHVDFLRWYDEGDVCNYILIATNLGLVKEVHLHTHHINYYLTPHHACICLHRAQFSTIQKVLSCISRGEIGVSRERERPITILFDDWMQRIIEAIKQGPPIN